MKSELVRKKAFQVVGVRKTTPYGGGTWGIIKSDGSKEKLEQLTKKTCDLGLCFGFGEDGSNDYMAGTEYEQILSEFDNYKYPATDFLVFQAIGTISGNTLGETWQNIHTTGLADSGYIQTDLPTIERYIEWDENTDTCHVEIMIPVTK